MLWQCSCIPSKWPSFFFNLISTRISLFNHAGLLPPLLNFFLRGMHCSCAWKKCCLKSDLHSWTPLPSRALAHGIPPSSSLKRAKSALLRSRVLILLIALLPPRRILFKFLLSTENWGKRNGSTGGKKNQTCENKEVNNFVQTCTFMMVLQAWIMWPLSADPFCSKQNHIVLPQEHTCYSK